MPSATVTPLPTRQRVLDAALASFSARGYEATSLDALAASLGVRKQTILYYFPNKEALLDAVLERTVGELAEAIERGLAKPYGPWARVEAVVTAVFRLTGRRPELLGLIREVTRLGEPFVSRLVTATGTLMARATMFLEREAEGGSMRPHDARAVLLQAYSALIGAGTEAEVLRNLGVAPSPRRWMRRRRELLDDLSRALRPMTTESEIITMSG